MNKEDIIKYRENYSIQFDLEDEKRRLELRVQKNKKNLPKHLFQKHSYHSFDVEDIQEQQKIIEALKKEIEEEEIISTKFVGNVYKSSLNGAVRQNYYKLKDYLENPIDDFINVNRDFPNATTYEKDYVFIDKDVDDSDFEEERFGVLTEEMLKYERMFRKQYKDKKFDFEEEEEKKDKKKAQILEFKKNNPDWHKEYVKNRLKTDDLFRLSVNYRTRTCVAFKSKGLRKKSKTREMLGCTFEEMQQHLINQFTEGMTIENYGEWHIDHIIPLSLANTKEELIKLTHYTNLQPLWASDNMSKNDKIIMDYVSKENAIRYKEFIDRYNSI